MPPRPAWRRGVALISFINPVTCCKGGWRSSERLRCSGLVAHFPRPMRSGASRESLEFPVRFRAVRHAVRMHFHEAHITSLERRCTISIRRVSNLIIPSQCN